jgi:ribosomal protein S18 acetylase RimI-like enzyme
MQEKIEIVIYEDKYAEMVSDMWNRSSEGWQGENWNKSPEQVRDCFSNSVDIRIYLALLGKKEVVGFCSLAEYSGEKNAWYIGLLNVRPDCHGKKIGKKLLLTAIKFAISQGVPRVDLHTWSGNLKAVPLYKKCGFFWVNNDKTTHLVNLIPKVLQMPLLKEYFEFFDWYNDSSREIEVKPDGRKDGEFELWKYSWEKDGKILELDFCRYGRGLRRIKTNDFEIITKLEKRKLVFGSSYRLDYAIKNLSGNQLEIEFTSQDDQMLSYDFNEKTTVQGEKIIESEFFINKFEKKIDENRSNPNVMVEAKINGKSLLFETGVTPQIPINIKYSYEISLFKDIWNPIDICLENMADESVKLSVNLMSDGNFVFRDSEMNIDLNAKEKKTIENHVKFEKYGIYQNKAKLIIDNSSGKTAFDRDIELCATGFESKLHTPCRDHEMIYIGNNFFYFDKSGDVNSMFFGKSGNGNGLFLPAPSLGKPFNKEFKIKPADFENVPSENSAKCKVTFVSGKFPGVSLIYHYEAFANGSLEFSIEVNRGDYEGELFANVYYWFPQADLAFAKDGEVIQIESSQFNWHESFIDFKNISENWIYCKSWNKSRVYGLVWQDDLTAKTGDWRSVWEIKLPEREQSFKSKKIEFHIDKFKNINELRDYATRNKNEKLLPKRPIEFRLNDGNPFAKDEITYDIIANSVSKIKGEFHLYNGSKLLDSLIVKDDNTRASFNYIDLQYSEDVQIINCRHTDSGITQHKRKCLFSFGNKSIENSVSVIDQRKVLTVANGIIEFSASSDFAPAIFSLKVNDVEWLDSSFPEVCPRSWWSPWAGGLSTSLIGVRLNSILKENIAVEFTSKEDQFGNRWSGMKISTNFIENEEFRGYLVNQYFLTLPECPVLATYTLVKNDSGHPKTLLFNQEAFIKADKLQDLFFEVDNINVQCGISETGIDCELARFQNRKREHSFYLIPAEELEKTKMNTNIEASHVTHRFKLYIRNSEVKSISPTFITFSKQDLKIDYFEYLRRLRFK